MRTPWGRIGGKRRLFKAIINLFPDNYEIYAEPFFGGGSVFFNLPKEKKTYTNGYK